MKKNKISVDAQMAFYEKAAGMTREQLVTYGVELISSARQPNVELIQQLPSMSKDRAMIAISNFIMKGYGMGVL